MSVRSLKSLLCAAAFSALLVASRAAEAQSYNAAQQFSGATDPNGVWSYGWEASRGAPFNLDTIFTVDASGLGSWHGALHPPYVGFNANPTPASEYEWSVPPDQMVFYPGPDGENAVLRWTAPDSGVVDVKTVFIGLDPTGPTSTDFAVLHGATTLLSGAIDSYDKPSSHSETIQVSAGDTIDVMVGYGKDHSNTADATEVQATISYTTLPHVSSIRPGSVDAGGPDLTVSLTGVNFAADASVVCDNNPLSTTYVSPTELQAVVPAALTATAGKLELAVSDPGIGSSNSVALRVLQTTVEASGGTISKNPNTGVYTVSLSLSNEGYLDAANLAVTAAALGPAGATEATSSSLPLSLGTLGPGGSVPVSLTFPAAGWTSGTSISLTLSGTFDGGSFKDAVKLTAP